MPKTLKRVSERAGEPRKRNNKKDGKRESARRGRGRVHIYNCGTLSNGTPNSGYFCMCASAVLERRSDCLERWKDSEKERKIENRKGGGTESFNAQISRESGRKDAR